MQRLLIRARGVMRDSLNNGCILNNLLFNLVVLDACVAPTGWRPVWLLLVSVDVLFYY